MIISTFDNRRCRICFKVNCICSPRCTKCHHFTCTCSPESVPTKKTCSNFIPVPGPPGPTGPPGANGTAASTDYAYIYQATAQIVPIETDVTFDTNGAIFGAIAHTVGDAGITINTPGDYKIIFSVTGQQSNQFALFINGTLFPGTIYGSNSTDQQNTGFAIIQVASPVTLTLRNHTSAGSVSLETLAGGTEANVTASILIQRL
ncbi:collagen-like protein [Bacillus sp. Cs-700]|uniref:collagen-like protein n=1 Tax=Bacillus sp. Cs-700 TaxID=2589818 RepID=UPI00140A5654|nr:collagen-like protein [Bacillus sp. Cs-700]